MAALEGFRELNKRDFAFSKVSAFGLFGKQRIVLKRKPVRRLFAIPRRGARYLDVSFLTSNQEIARGAVDVAVRYFSLGGQIDHEHIVHRLFADPQHKADVQRLWFQPPKGAAFAEIAFSRAVRNGHKVGLDASLKLKRAKRSPSVKDFDAVLASRDISAMALVLKELEGLQDRARARALLGRMCFLSHDTQYTHKLTSLDDTDRLLRFGPNIDLACAKLDGNNTFVYNSDKLEAEQRVLPLGKALKVEADRVACAMQSNNAGIVLVSEGPNWLGRLIVASLLKRSNKRLNISVDWQAFKAQAQTLGSWMTFENGASFLETDGGRALQLLCDENSGIDH